MNSEAEARLAAVARRFDTSPIDAKIAAGTTNNIIPESAEMLGTIRTLSPERRAMVARELKRLAPAIAAAHGCTAEVEIEEGFPVPICDSRAVAFAPSTEIGKPSCGERVCQ